MSLNIVVNSVNLFTFLSCQRWPINESIVADVSVIQYKFERQNVGRFTCISRKVNLPDVGTKLESAVVNECHLKATDGHLNIYSKLSLNRQQLNARWVNIGQEKIKQEIRNANVHNRWCLVRCIIGGVFGRTVTLHGTERLYSCIMSFKPLSVII